MSTTWYSTDDMAVVAENMSFSSPATAVDAVTDSEDTSTWITDVWNVTMANSSVGSITDMPHCDTNKPILIIVTQVIIVSISPDTTVE
jgi:hypothetical protein